MDNSVSVKNIGKYYLNENGKHLPVLQNINLDIHKGEFFIFLGASGAGKSTLLRVMSGLEKASEGRVEFDRQIVKTDISFVFQQFALLPWMNVHKNIELGLAGSGLDVKSIKTAVEIELRRFGLDKFSESFPRDLSGGMRQRVGIARALIKRPKIMFMDEPFSELDSFTAEELRKDLLKIWQEMKMTIIMVTHLIPEAIELADRIAVLTPRPAKIKSVLENNLPRPRTLRSKDFFDIEDKLAALIKP